MGKFITELVGHGSHNKHIPLQTINAPEEFIIGLLDGYISGDGTIGDNYIEDYQGARNYGFQTLLIRRKENIDNGINSISNFEELIQILNTR